MMKPHIGTSITFSSLGLVYIVYVTVNIVTHQNQTTTAILHNKDIIQNTRLLTQIQRMQSHSFGSNQITACMHQYNGQKWPCIL